MTTRAGGAPLSAKLFAVGGWLLATVGAVGAIALRIADPVPQLRQARSGSAIRPSSASLSSAWPSLRSAPCSSFADRPISSAGLMVMIGVGYAVGILFAAITFSLAAHPSTVAWLTCG